MAPPGSGIRSAAAKSSSTSSNQPPPSLTHKSNIPEKICEAVRAKHVHLARLPNINGRLKEALGPPEAWDGSQTGGEFQMGADPPHTRIPTRGVINAAFDSL